MKTLVKLYALKEELAHSRISGSDAVAFKPARDAAYIARMDFLECIFAASASAIGQPCHARGSVSPSERHDPVRRDTYALMLLDASNDINALSEFKDEVEFKDLYAAAFTGVMTSIVSILDKTNTRQSFPEFMDNREALLMLINAFEITAIARLNAIVKSADTSSKTSFEHLTPDVINVLVYLAHQGRKYGVLYHLVSEWAPDNAEINVLLSRLRWNPDYIDEVILKTEGEGVSLQLP